MTGRRYTLAVDPGGQHTGICLIERTAYGLMPIDGLTLDRLPSESDADDNGAPIYARRVTDACFVMLDRHRIEDDQYEVCVETLKRTKIMCGPMPKRLDAADAASLRRIVATLLRVIRALRQAIKAMRDTTGALVVLGAVVGAWPDAHCVSPANHDHAAAGYPSALRGRTPRGWTTAGGTARVHQRAAWAVAVASLRKRKLDVSVVPDPVEAAVRAGRLAGGKAGLGVLLAAVQTSAKGSSPQQVAEWAFVAAKMLRPETPDTLRDRLLAKAAEPAVA